MKKDYLVATFWVPSEGQRLCVSNIRAYIRWCPPEWLGYLLYSVEAESGPEARKIARRRRLKHETNLPGFIRSVRKAK